MMHYVLLHFLLLVYNFIRFAFTPWTDRTGDPRFQMDQSLNELSHQPKCTELTEETNQDSFKVDQTALELGNLEVPECSSVYQKKIPNLG